MRDAEVVTSIVAGDPDGLAAAYDRYADPLFKYCRTLLGDPADAADAVQDTFVIAASRLEGLLEPERFRPWLYTVARNECLRDLRFEKGTPALDEAPDVTDAPGDASGHAEKAGLWTLFEDATAGLTPGEREVIELQLRQGLEAGEVATVLGVSRNRAHTLLSRARDQLEICLAVLLVGRAGRDACGELGAMLTGWGGRLTVPLRERVYRHIEFCMICSTRRDLELRSAMLLDLSPGAALAAGAAESFRIALGAPLGLKSHTIALATGHEPSAVAHSTAVLSRAGTFGKHGFPRPVRTGKAGLAGQHGAGVANASGARASGARAGGGKAGLRSSPRGQAAAAAVVLAVVIAAVTFALTGNSGHFTPTADPRPVASMLAPRPASPVAKTSRPKPSPKPPATTAAPTTAPKPSPTTPLPVPATPRPAAPTTPRPAPTTPGPSPTPTTPQPTTPPPTTASPPPATASPSPSPSPSPTPGTESVSPDGGALLVAPGWRGAQVYLSAYGGPVNWSASVANDPNNVISVSPGSGTLTPGGSVTVTITASQFVRCGFATQCPTVTIWPNGTVFTIYTGRGQSVPGSARDRQSAPLPSATSSVQDGAPATPPRRHITIRL
jgi:RNA polymerase sigma factor (sigma-70 family)